MKWVILFTALLVVLVSAGPVGADTTADITITATGYIGEAPGGLTLTYISDYEIGISWIPGFNSTNTLLRAAYGRPVEDRDDGFEVYYGNGSNTTLWIPNVGVVSPIHIKAWSEVCGAWEEVGTAAEANFMSISFLFISLVVLAIGATATSFWKRNIVLSLGACLSWLVLGFLLLTNESITAQYSLDESWVQILAFLLFAMAIGCILWFISGIGKTKITMTDSAGRSWQMWGKPPETPEKSRSQMVKERHRSRLKEAKTKVYGYGR